MGEHGELIASAPPVDEVEQFSGQRIEAWIASEHEEEAVTKTVSAVSDVVGVEINEVAAPQAATAPAAVRGAGAPSPTVAEADAPAQDAEPARRRSRPLRSPRPLPAKAAAPKASGAARTVRVDAERLDALMHSMGELVIHRTAVEALTSSMDVPGLQQAMQELTRSSQALQSMVMQVRMIPVDVVFLRFPRLVRDLSGKLGKEVKLNLVGSETELDRTVVDALGDPLVHLVRNSLDHGLEPVEERVAAGKPEVGTLEISARHAGGSVVIEVRDDGRGIDPEAVARKAVERGLIDAAAAAEINMKAAVELLFARRLLHRRDDQRHLRPRRRHGRGAVEDPRAGRRGHPRLGPRRGHDRPDPPAADAGDRLGSARRCRRRPLRDPAGPRRAHAAAGRADGALGRRAPDAGARRRRAPAAGRRRRVWTPVAPRGEHEFVVIVRAQEQRLALSVDDLIGQRELVTRPLPSAVSGEPVSGGAALADGRIALIVDCDALDTRAPKADSRDRGARSSEISTVTGNGRVAA